MSCLYSKLVLNPKYLPNKKNNHNPPKCTDERIKYVPVSCGRCIECRKKRRREWMVRLSEELREGNRPPLFVTLTISNEQLQRVKGDANTKATKFVRWFLENIRKKTRKSAKHYLVSELGKERGRIHLHGFIWTEKELVKNCWIYGYVHIGDFVNEKSIYYMTKYMLKKSIDKNFIPKVLASKGIGKGYLNREDAKRNKYKEEDTKETYRFRNGSKTYLPQYYRNKIYSDKEKEKLWVEKIEKGVVYICKEKVNPNEEEYYKILDYHRKRTEKILGDNPQEWEADKIRKRRAKLKKYLEDKRR